MPRRLASRDVLHRLLEDTDSDEDHVGEDGAQEREEDVDVSSDTSNDSDDTDQENESESQIIAFTSADGTLWKTEPPLRNSRQNSKNILHHRPGPKQFILLRVDDTTDVFLELFGHENLVSIVEYTLKEAKRQGDDKFSFCVQKLKAFLGLCIIRGVLKGKNEPIRSFWSEDYGRSIFKNTMSRNAFQSILRYLRFDDKDSRRERRKNDKFTAIRSLWESVMSNCQKCFSPYSGLTVDEQLFACRSRCPFTQYLPNKPGKFGVKFWLICCSQTNYILSSFPYVGKEDRPEIGLADHVVTRLVRPYFGMGLNVTMDNFFTSLRLARSLLEQKTTLVGTLRSNKREIPKEILMNKQDTLYSSKFVFTEQENITLVSYKAKKNKTVFLLSSAHSSKQVSMSEKKKPEIVLDYNNDKGAVDTADEMLKAYSTKAATRRWPLAVFFNLIDIVCLDAFIICREADIVKNSRRQFLISLGESLSGSMKNDTKAPTSSHDRKRKSSPPVQPSSKRMKCKLCKSNKCRSKCKICQDFVCGPCSSAVCNSCSLKQ